MSKEKEDRSEVATWSKFYKEFNKDPKTGCYEDVPNRSKLSKLLRFKGTKSEASHISLDKYLDRMSESQESIYYMSGDSIETMMKAPALQIFNKKDLEVLSLVVHLAVRNLPFMKVTFVSFQKADVKLDETDEEKKKFPKLRTCTSPSPTGQKRC